MTKLPKPKLASDKRKKRADYMRKWRAKKKVVEFKDYNGGTFKVNLSDEPRSLDQIVLEKAMKDNADFIDKQVLKIPPFNPDLWSPGTPEPRGQFAQKFGGPGTPVHYGDFNLRDSGERTKFSTGAVRDTGSGKGRFDLLPAYPLLRLAKLYEAGAKKYAERNWEKGIPTGRFMDSAFRHLMNYQDGDREEDHLAAVLWNVCGLMWTQEQVRRGKLPKELLTLPEPTDAPRIA